MELESDHDVITSAMEEDSPPIMMERAASAHRNAIIEPKIVTQDETSRVDRAAAVDLTGDESDPEEMKSELKVVVKLEEELGDEASKKAMRKRTILKMMRMAWIPTRISHWN